jgi:single-strand DNA-binding protein
MSSFNRVILLGNLTRDPQLKFTPSQTAVVEFGVAMNRKYKGANGEEKEEVTFVDVAGFGKMAEVINQHFQKGKQILIEGRLKFDSWEDKQGGGKRSKLSVIADSFQFVGGRDEQGGGNSRQPAATGRGPAPSRPPQRTQRPPVAQPFGDEQQFKEEDIPF